MKRSEAKKSAERLIPVIKRLQEIQLDVMSKNISDNMVEIEYRKYDDGVIAISLSFIINGVMFRRFQRYCDKRYPACELNIYSFDSDEMIDYLMKQAEYAYDKCINGGICAVNARDYTI